MFFISNNHCIFTSSSQTNRMRYQVRLIEDSQIYNWFDSPDAAINQCKEHNDAVSKEAGYEVKNFEVYDHEEDRIIF